MRPGRPRDEVPSFEAWLASVDAYWELFGPPPEPEPKRPYPVVRL